MITLKEICEGLLKGQEETLMQGDEIAAVIKEFEELKELVCDIKNYEKFSAGRAFAIRKEIPRLCKYVGVRNEDYNIIGFSIVRYGDGMHWYCNSQLIDPDKMWAHKCLVLPKLVGMQRTKEKQLEKCIKPIFADFNTFVNWFSAQVKERKY